MDQRLTDPDAFLRAYHEVYAGETARVFGGGRTADGRSSYDVLAELPAPGARVLDVGCGDGHLLALLRARGFAPEQLVGVDMSEHELAAAARRPSLQAVTLYNERAQAMSPATDSVDWVLSHLAFMLMAQPRVVLGEIARVLRPGGSFATIVGGGPVEGEAFSLFLELFREVYASCETKAPRLGDKRTRSEEGLAELCDGLGYDEPTETVYDVHLDGTAAQVWQRVHTVYESFALSEAAVEGLRARFVAEASARWGDAVPCVMRLRLLRAGYFG